MILEFKETGALTVQSQRGIKVVYCRYIEKVVFKWKKIGLQMGYINFLVSIHVYLVQTHSISSLRRSKRFLETSDAPVSINFLSNRFDTNLTFSLQFPEQVHSKGAGNILRAGKGNFDSNDSLNSHNCQIWAVRNYLLGLILLHLPIITA